MAAKEINRANSVSMTVLFKKIKNMKFVLLAVAVLSVCLGVILAQSNSHQGVTFSFKLTDGKTDQAKTSFRVGEEIVIETSLTNNSNESFPFRTTDEFYLYRFSLTKPGEGLPVSYRSDRARMLSMREEQRGGYKSQLTLDPILPGEAQKLATMKLSERYENLEPGTYTLWIEYKTGKIAQVNGADEELRLSHEVTFEVAP